MEKCKNTGGISEVYFFNPSDMKIVNVVIRMKRKYGKFTRPITKIKL